jgi:asparagine synthase (glutamine-hydrolysing)
VVLSGDGGDELFAGYERYLVDQSREKFERIPALIRRHLMLRASRALPRGAYGKNFLRNIALDPSLRYIDSLSFFGDARQDDLFAPEFRAALAGHRPAAAFQQIYDAPGSRQRLDHLLYLDSKTYLPGDIMTKVDRMSMAHSVEAREPLLDHKLIEFAASLPASLKLRGPETKSILKRALRGLIPDQIIDRPKQGFDVPIQKWFKEDLRAMLCDTLTDRRTRERGYFNAKAVDGILDEHLRGRRNNARHLWGLLTLELWHRAFIDRAPDMAFAGAKPFAVERLKVR